VYRSENVGTSSTNFSENLKRRKPEVSRATRIVPGLVDPKVRPKGVADGQQVNIPALGKVCLHMRISAVFASFGYVRAARQSPNRKRRTMKVKEVPRKVCRR
jgi:hypothetical protein